MVSVVTVRSKLYLNIIGKVIPKDFGYTPRVGNNTTAVNEDDALYVFSLPELVDRRGFIFLQKHVKASQQNIFKALRFNEVILLRCRL